MSGDFAVRCYDCDRLYAPLEQRTACEMATKHCDNNGHMDVHAVPFEFLLPLIGTFSNDVPDKNIQ